MPPVKKLAELPDTLKTYVVHGIDLNYRKGVPEAVGTCPFCARDNKFSVKVETGQWRCLVCNEGPEKDKSIRGGNAVVFLRTIYRLSKEAMSSKSGELAQLAVSRGFLSAKILESWGVVKSISTNEWLIPGYNPEGALCQLYRYVKLGDKLRLLATPPSPTLQHQIHGLNFWGKSKEVVFVCEGPWDGMALHEVLSQTKSTENGLAATGNVKLSLFNEVNIVALPGCNTFKPQWSKLFANKRVVVLFDNDHPKKNEATGKMVPPASIEGLKRFCEIVSSSETPPASLEYLKWGEAGYAETLPSGMDLRDSFMNSGKLLGSRIKALDKILGKISPVPSEWVKSTPETVRSSPRESLCIPCDSYKDLITAWRKAMRWTDGLDCALTVMLASIASVRLVGDQLWVKIIGPASCLDGDTPIYDPVANETVTVRERTLRKEKFFVFSKTSEGKLVITQALPPEESNPTPMYEVEFESGKKLRVTAGHEVWNGETYVSIQQILTSLQLPESDAHRLPTISEFDLSTQTQGALHSTRTVVDSQSDYPVDFYSYDEQPQSELEDVQYDSALLNDAQESIESCYLHKDESLCTHHLLQDDRFSSSHVLSLVSSSLYENVTELRNSINVVEQLFRLSPFDDNTQQEKLLLNKDRPIVECELQSNASRKQHCCLGGSYKRELEPLETQQLCHVESNLPGRVECNDQSFPDSNPAFEVNEIELHSLGDNVEGLSVHIESVDNTLQTSFLKDTSQQVPVDALETSLNEQPSYTSIVKGIDLGPLSLPEFDRIVKISYIGERNYYDFHVPITNNYWAEGFFHHNCGKTSIAKALGTASDYVLCEDVIRGFTSGWRAEGGEDAKGYDLATRIKNKTMITMDGDTLMQSPNLSNILGEGRRLYDGQLSSHFKNGMGKSVDQHRFTWIICGTSSLRSMDSSELGERFLDCVIMEGIDDDLEDEILLRVANRTVRNMSTEVSDRVGSMEDPEMEAVMNLTGGYVEWLRKNAAVEMSSVETSDKALHFCTRLGKFVAFMRARPSSIQDEVAEREFAARLVTQHIRLATCLAVVMNKKSVDQDVLRRTQKVAFDTARGRTVEITRHLYEAGENGLEVKALAHYTNNTEAEVRKLLKFLRDIGVTTNFIRKAAKGISGKPVWILTPKLIKLWKEVHQIQ